MGFRFIVPSLFALLGSAVAAADVPVRQVLVEARIVETTREFSRSLGIDWTTTFPDNPNAGVPTSLPTFGAPAETGSTLDIDAILAAIDADPTTRLIGEPRIITLPNDAATIQLGDDLGVEFPDAFRPFGVELQITPSLTSDGRVGMDIDVDSSALEGAGPTLTQRQTHTQVVVPNGQTAVLGGLIDSDTLETGTKLPVLTNVPLLGRLFRPTVENASKPELLIFITPQILGEDGEPTGGAIVVPVPEQEESQGANWPVPDTSAGDVYVGLGVGGNWIFNDETDYGLTFPENSNYLQFDNTVPSGEGKLMLGWLPTERFRLELDLSGGGGKDTDRGGDTNQLGDLFRIDGQNFTMVNQTQLNQQQVETYEFDSTLRLQTLVPHGDTSDLLFTTGLGYRHRGTDTHFSNEISGGGPFFPNLLDVEVRENSMSAVLGATYIHGCGPNWGVQAGVESQLGVGWYDFEAHQYGGGITNGTRVDGSDTVFVQDTKLQLGLYRNLGRGQRLLLGFDVGGRSVPSIRDARFGQPLDIRYDTVPYTGLSLTYYWNPCSTCGRGAGIRD